jgi:cell shape-determining protein MreD
MSGLLRSLGRLLRKRRRPNRRVARFAKRAVAPRGLTPTLGPPSKEATKLWRALVWGAVALVLCQVEAGLLPHLGSTEWRIDLPLLVITFCALRLGAIEGAVSAFVLGWVGDLFVQGPPGLCRFLAVAVWWGVRVSSAKAKLPPAVAPVVFTLAGAVVYEAGVLAGLAFVAEGGTGPGTIAWISVVPRAILTALAAWPLHAGLARLETWTEGARA